MAERRKRLYRIEETITVVGIGYVEATSKAEAEEIAKRGGVEFTWNDGQDIRRGDGLHAHLVKDAR